MTTRLTLLIISSLLCYAQIPAQEEEELLEKAGACVQEGGDCSTEIDLYLNSMSDSDSLHAEGYLKVVSLFQRRRYDPVKMTEWAQKGIESTQLKDHPRLKSHLLFNVGVGKVISGQAEGEDIRSVFEECKSLAYESKDIKTISRAHSGMVTLYQFEGEIELRIQELLMQKEQVESSGDSSLMISPIRGLAMAYYDNEDFERSKEFFSQVMAYHMAEGDSMNYYRNLSSWANCCLSQDDAVTALPALEECVDYMIRMNDTRYIPFPQAQLGRAYHMLDRNQEAIEVLVETAERCAALQIAKQKAYTDVLLSQSYGALGQHAKAVEFSGRALEYYEDQSVLFESLDAQELHAKNLKNMGLYEESLIVYERMVARKDSLMDENKMKEVARLQEELEAEKKELLLCAQESEIAVLEDEKRRVNNRNILLIFGLVLSGLIAWLVVRAKNAQVKLRESENEKLGMQLEHRDRELTSQALHLAQKNEILGAIKDDLSKMRITGEGDEMNELINKLRFDKHMDSNWDQFMKVFVGSNPDFISKLKSKHDDLSKNEFKLCAMLHMKLSSKDVAAILNVSDEAVKKARYRLRKKLGLNTEDGLEQYLMEL